MFYLWTSAEIRFNGFNENIQKIVISMLLSAIFGHCPQISPFLNKSKPDQTLSRQLECYCTTFCMQMQLLKACLIYEAPFTWDLGRIFQSNVHCKHFQKQIVTKNIVKVVKNFERSIYLEGLNLESSFTT